MNLKQLSSVAALLFLAACAQPNLPQQNNWQVAEQVQDFSADGRLAVKVEGKGSYANFDWTYQNAVQTIDVNTPLGNTVGQLCQDSEGVLAVDSKGKVYQAETAEELSRQLLGFALPVQYLHIWADGKRVANAPYKILPDGRLEQFDWTISRTLNSSEQPKTLQLENAKFNIRLVFDTVNHSLDKNGQTRCAARK
ncbi:outer membrane lipoprotein LolB [Neisseria flavescens]|uniref:Outer-membrane lipoprotein LolB n=1 Tax=Neisseria flavescens NRL30031/H210 TaxID=546264 RepID=C0ENM6_NEIFL|nr:lipoprotein insertase outer membrane protein LolB [Neisseria flavescens]SPY04566.1 outer membrane lipoprotein [Neisseria meningitidis]VTX88936.1 Outer-membrane lipoprotein LolB [Neisseria subflava]EEG33403.1 outer membrane lipoprotein LolB [Neisseria flavescens NRL30031/H210]QCL68554.1 outer membrane lipoprotein LolB [Neisseria flavescens]SPY06239.1 outer membrane lipoprotein [Neisseria meningitidis]